MPFFSESQALGTGSSPWTVNGNDLYPDSTSYIVGIGTDNPDTLLHLKAADGTPKIKLEGTSYDYTIEVDANHSASQNSSLLRFESDTHFATNQVEFKNGTTNTSSSVELYLAARGSSSITFRDDDETADGKTKSQFLVNYATDRLYLYGEDGFAGGMFTMDFSPASDARFAFGYGDEALSNAARLAIKHTSSPQLLLDDGTQTATAQVSNEALTFGHSDSSYNFTVNATTNANLAFAKGGTVKANIRHHGDLEDGLFGVQSGLWRWFATSSTASTQNPTASTGFGNVLMLDPGNQSAAQTVNLPAIANYAGGFFKLIDSTGTSASYNITVQPQTGEKLNGVTNGTFVLDQNFQQAVCYATSTGWFIESNSKVDVPLRLDANENQLTFFDTDGGSTDVGSVLTYAETASNQSKLRYHMNGASFDGNYIELQAGASPRLQINQQEGSDTVDAFIGIGGSGTEFQLGTGTADSTKIYTGNTARAEFTSAGDFKLIDGSNGLNIDVQSTTRRTLFGDVAAGDAGGNFNIEYNDSGSGTAQTYFSFGYGDDAHPYDARLSIKEATLPQLSLTDGSETTTFETNSNALVVHQDSNWDFMIDANAGANANLRFSEAGVTKAGLVHLGATESGLVQRSGFFRDSITAASGATVAINATTTGNVIACDTTSNAITATLPAVATYSGSIVYVIDSKGNAGTTNPSSRAITIAVQTGEKLDGVLNGTATIASDFGFTIMACTADGWFQVGG